MKNLKTLVAIFLVCFSGKGFTQYCETFNAVVTEAEEENPGQDGYNHPIGLKEVTARWSSNNLSDDYHSTLDASHVPVHEVDIEVEVKQKGGQWPSGNTCAKAYITKVNDRNFNDRTRKLGKSCDELDEGGSASDDDYNLKIENIKIAHLIRDPGTYWIYTVVEYDDGENTSTEGDGDEHVRVVVHNHPSTDLTIHGLTSGETIVGDQWSLYGYVANNGSHAPYNDVQVTAKLNGSHFHTKILNWKSIRPGENTRVTIGGSAPNAPANYTLEVCVNSPPTITESGTSPNCTTSSLNVRPRPGVSVGYHESSDCNYARGWAQNYGLPNGGLVVEAHSSNMDGTHPQYHGSVSTNIFRGDLNGNHGWQWQIPESLKDGKARRLTFYAWNHPYDGSKQELPRVSSLGSNQYICTPSNGNVTGLVSYWSSTHQCHTLVRDGEVPSTSGNANWNLESTIGYVFRTYEPGTVPVYRAWRRSRHLPSFGRDFMGCHFFTTSQAEYGGLSSSEWIKESDDAAAFYVYPNSSTSETKELGRYYRDHTVAHGWPVPSQRSAFLSEGFRREGALGWILTSLPIQYIPPPDEPEDDNDQSEGIDGTTLDVRNVTTDSTYQTGTATCFPYHYTSHRGGATSVTELAQIFTSDWSQMVVDMSRTLNLTGNTSGEECANVDLPDLAGDYVANICLSLWDGSSDMTKCANAPFSIEDSTDNDNPPVNNGIVELTWFDLFDQNWSTATVFSTDQQIPVIFGIANGTNETKWIYAEVKTFTGSWNLITTESQTVELAAGADKPPSGHDPRFSVSFSQPGEYIVQICAAGVCLDSKRITVRKITETS